MNVARNIAVIEGNYYIYFSTRVNSTMHYSYQAKTLTTLNFTRKNYLFFLNHRLFSQCNYALEEYLNDYFRHFLMVKIKHRELKTSFDNYIHEFPVRTVLFCKHICKLKKVSLILLYLSPHLANIICKKYFPECIHQYMKAE